MNTNPDAKRILFFGDSIIWGKIPGSTERYDSKTRISCVVQDILGKNFEVIEEGLRARTAYGENAFFSNRNGYEHFVPVVASHLPLDLIVILLGSNDFNKGFDYKSKEVTNNLIRYPDSLNYTLEFFNVLKPEFLFVCPPVIIEEYLGDLKPIFEGAENKMIDFPKSLKLACEKLKYAFLDSNDVVHVSNTDGIHLEKEDNILLGKQIAKEIIRIFNH